MFRCTSVAAVMVTWLYLVASAHAQIVTGSIIGAITDESGSVLPGVTVTIASTSLPGGPATMVTDANGRYRFTGLAAGTYTLNLALPGFATYEEDGLRLVTGGTIERNVTLKLAGVAETITVSGQSPMVDTRNVGVTTTTTREVIENLPTMRLAMVDYLQVQPGVVATSPGSLDESVQIMGAPRTETLHVYDGVITNHPRTGASWQGGDVDVVEEIQTVALGPSAEYGASAASVVNVITTSGTNTFRGDATAYWKPNGLQSRPILLDCGCPDGKTGFNLGAMRDLTAHVSGPLVRDRLWYRTGFQYYEFTFSEPGSYPPEQPTSWWNKIPTKVTWQVTDTLKFSQLMHLEWWGGYASGPSRAVALEAAATTDKAQIHSYGSEVNKTFGNAAVLTVRAGGWWAPNEHRGSVIGDLVTPSHTDNLTGYVSQGVPQMTKQIIRRDAQSLKMERYIAGPKFTHNLRFGLQLERAHGVLQSAFPSGAQYYDYGGAPDYALFRDPSVQGAAFSTQGVWGEDQVTVGARVTLSLGLRFDRMNGTSSDEDAVDNKLDKTGAKIQGLGDMFTWKVWAPRLGVNLKLTKDGRTVLRGTYGRAYRQIFLNEFDLVHPGISSITEARYNPTTRGYTQIVSVTNSRSNLAVDKNLSAPRTDTFSIGLDRQLMFQVAVNASYVYKHGDNLVGWRDIGGIYGETNAVLPDGRGLTVYPLLNPPGARVFLRTNRSEYFDTYKAFVASVTKRMSHRWQGQVNLTLSRSEGLRLAGVAGRDPNDLTTATGRLSATDRPVMFTANGSYDIPRIDVRVSANYQNLSNLPFAPQAFVQLPQGRRAINIEAPGAFRSDRVQLLYLRVNKIVRLGGHRQIDLIANVLNALQSEAPTNRFVTFNYFSPTYGQPIAWVQPRQLYMGARVQF